MSCWQKTPNPPDAFTDVRDDFSIKVEHRILPALRAGTVVLADRFIFTLIRARRSARHQSRYISGLYAMALRRTHVLAERASGDRFAREFQESASH